jgi:hypothetical protein
MGEALFDQSCRVTPSQRLGGPPHRASDFSITELYTCCAPLYTATASWVGEVGTVSGNATPLQQLTDPPRRNRSFEGAPRSSLLQQDAGRTRGSWVPFRRTQNRSRAKQRCSSCGIMSGFVSAAARHGGNACGQGLAASERRSLELLFSVSRRIRNDSSLTGINSFQLIHRHSL